MDEEGVTRENGFAEFHFVRTHEVTNFSGVLGVKHHEDAGDLGHGFDLQHAGHDGVVGEVALEEGFVDGDRFDAGALGVALEGDDAVDHEERIPVGEDLHDLRGGEDALADREPGRRDHGHHFGVFLGNGHGELGVGSVAGAHGDDMAEQRASDQGEVADDIEDLVTDEFVRKTERLFAQHGVVADDNGIFEAAAADEAFLHERLDVFVVDEGAGGGDVVFVNLRGDFEAEVLRVVAVRTSLGAGDAELGVGQDDQNGAVLGLDGDGFADLAVAARGILFDDTGFFDQRDVGGAAAVADGWLVGVHLDERVVNPEAGEGGENVFDGVDLDVAFNQGGGALDGADVGGESVDGRPVFEVGATELEPVIDGGWVDGEGDLFAGMERNARERGGTG